ncbi:hypothetical protein PCE1_004109 [Barthelona sp. PCE]
MKVGFICAMDCEMTELLELFQDVTVTNIGSVDYHAGMLFDHEMVICCSGVGKVCAGIAAAILCSHFSVDLVINIGVSGGVKPLNCRDIVFSTGAVQHDFNTAPFDPPMHVCVVNKLVIPVSENDARTLAKIAEEMYPERSRTGLVLTGDQFVHGGKADELLRLIDETEWGPEKPMAIEMEGGAVAQACHMFKTRCVVIRYVSDVLGDSNQVSSFEEIKNDHTGELIPVLRTFFSNIQ